MYSIFVLVLLFSNAFTFDNFAPYLGYKVYDIYANNVTQKKIIYILSKNSKYDFFELPKSITMPSPVMVAPTDQWELEALLKRFDIRYVVSDSNVGLTEKQDQIEANSRTRTMAGGELIDFTKFLTLNETYSYINELAKMYPERCTVKTAGKSYENRPILSITITDGSKNNVKKNVILIDAGIHSREWISHAESLYIMHQLVEKFENNKLLLKHCDWVIIPVVNPDGYEFTHTSYRMWRKTRKPVSKKCTGTDANRNFDYKWKTSDSKESPCSNTFGGIHAFSETEAQAVRDVMLSMKNRVILYVTLHAYGRVIMYPWSWTREPSRNRDKFHSIAEAAAKNMERYSGKKYKIGAPSEILYIATGSSFDYAYGVLNIPFTFGIEMPGSKDEKGRFSPPPQKILPYVEETWIGIKSLVESVNKKERSITLRTLQNSDEKNMVEKPLPKSDKKEKVEKSISPIFYPNIGLVVLLAIKTLKH